MLDPNPLLVDPSICEEVTMNIFERLCQYEDEEEAGKLLHLPCAFGDTIYRVCSICSVCLKEDDCDHCSEKNHFMILEDKFDLGYLMPLGDLPTSVFVTQNEAADYLRELELYRKELLKKHGQSDVQE